MCRRSKIPSLLGKIKRPTQLGYLLVSLFTALTLAACAPLVLEAPFPARPDTVEPGSLLGPFDGRVVDAATGKPLQGALVYASWGFDSGAPARAPAGAMVRTTETDSDGRYRLEALAAKPSGAARLVRFTLIVYKRGYVAYRSDRRFEDSSRRYDFAQRGNAVRLDPFGPQLSHAEHLRFIGGSGRLRKQLQAEAVQASLELSSGRERASVSSTGPLLDAAVLLSADELAAVTGYTGTFNVDRLGDLERSASYDSCHFRATGKPESFDAAIRVWKLGSGDELEQRYRRLLAEVPHAESRNEVGDRSLIGRDQSILAAAVEDRARGVVVELTCGVELCKTSERTVVLLRRVLERTQRLGRAASGENPAREEATSAHVEPSPAPAEGLKPLRLRPPQLKP